MASCGFGGEPLTLTDSSLIRGSMTADTNTTNWDARYSLLNKLIRFPGLATGSAATYLSANNTSSPWKFAHAEELFDAAYTLPSGLNTRLLTALGQYRVYADSILLLDALQASDTTTYDTTIAKKRVGVFSRLGTVTDTLTVVQGAANTSIQSALSTAATYISGLPTGKQYEANLQGILNIAVRYAQWDSLVTTDSTLLRSIAAQCQQFGGVSVRRASYWLDEDEDIRYIDKNWDTACTPGARAGKVATAGLFRIAPNPANNYLQIQWPVNEMGNWRISDLTGRILQTGVWSANENDTVINTADWNPGLYFLTARSAAGSVSNIKFIINR